MKKLIKILLAIFEFIFYTFFMVLMGEISITNEVLKLILHLGSITIISLALYFIIHFILIKLNLKSRKDMYHVCFWNLGLGILFPILLIVIIPNDYLTIFSFLILVSTVYYGIFINTLICIFNHLLTNRRKK